MRFRIGTVTVCAIAAGLAAGGCASSSSSTPSAATAAASASSTGPAAASAAASSAATAPAAASGGTCQPGDLSFALGAKSGTSQVTQAVDLTNKGSSACTLDGFPGVDLVGVANGQQDFTWSLVRASRSYSKVTLQAGRGAHFNLIYLPGSSGGSGDITVAKLVLTPPNDSTQAEITWNQSVLLQDGATHPGTYITPVVSGF